MLFYLLIHNGLKIPFECLQSQELDRRGRIVNIYSEGHGPNTSNVNI